VCSPNAGLILTLCEPPGYGDEGLRAATEIRHRFPEVALLVLSQYIEAEYALRLLDGTEHGVGYLLKDRILDTTQLSGAINRVLAGGVVVDPALVAQLLERPLRADPFEELTPREREVLNLTAEGLTDRGIAQRLYVSPKTVETHTRHIFQAFSLNGRIWPLLDVVLARAARPRLGSLKLRPFAES
jgi:DNA-binding NarL/FixJ family response regulator